MALEYFNAYHSYLESIEPLNDAERGRLFTALLEYSSTGVTPDLRGNERFIFPTMKGQIDRDIAKYEAKCHKNSEIASKRWDANGCERIRTDANACERIFEDANDAKEKEKEKAKDKAKDKEKAKESNNKRFTPPTLAEIADYCRERGSDVDPKRFFDYFEANNWVDSKGQKVKSWKQKVISWEGRNGNTPKRGRNDALLESIKRDMYDTSRCEGLYIPDESALVEL